MCPNIAFIVIFRLKGSDSTRPDINTHSLSPVYIPTSTPTSFFFSLFPLQSLPSSISSLSNPFPLQSLPSSISVLFHTLLPVPHFPSSVPTFLCNILTHNHSMMPLSRLHGLSALFLVGACLLLLFSTFSKTLSHKSIHASLSLRNDKLGQSQWNSTTFKTSIPQGQRHQRDILRLSNHGKEHLQASQYIDTRLYKRALTW